MHIPILITVAVLAAACVFLACRLRCQQRNMNETEHAYDEIFRHISSYVLLVDENFQVLKTNYFTLTGRAPTAELPKVGNLLRCKNGEDAGECGTHGMCALCPVRAAIAEAFRTKRDFNGLEAPMVLYTSDDRTQTVDCEVAVSGICLRSEGHPRLVLTVHDISTQKRIRHELDEARMRAEESDRMKSQFLANTSHELRTPLNAIVGFSELLAAAPTPEERQEYVRIIRMNNELLLQLFNDILDLSKIEAGTLDFDYADVELDTVMEELEGIFRMKQPAESPVRIVFRRHTPSCVLHTDRKRLAQVVSNFLSNAVKFTEAGSIEFGYEIRGKELRIYVTDTGRGISETGKSQLFKRFAKVGSHKQGVGIGLAICKSVVESMGGRIGAESEAGKGSTFWLTLPYAPVEGNQA